jgi:hypothetical protein
VEDLDEDERLSEWISKKKDWVCVNLVYLIQDRALWRAMVITVVEVRGSINSREFLD